MMVRTFSTKITVLLAAILLGTSGWVRAQNPAFDIRDLAALEADQLNHLDDVAVLPDGTIIVSRPQLFSLGVLDRSVSPAAYTPLVNVPNVVAGGLAVDPNGDLYFGDSIYGCVYRYEFATQTLVTVASGYNIPLDLIIEDIDTIYVVDLTSSDFFGGICKAYRVELTAGIATSQTLVIDNILGAGDIEFAPNGKFYVAGLGFPGVVEYDPVTMGVTVLAQPIIFPSDILVLANGDLLISALFESKVYLVTPSTGNLVEMATGLGSTGSGAEDLALDIDGCALVTVNTGEMYKIDLTSELRQEGVARSGEYFRMRLDAPSLPGADYIIFAALSANAGVWIPDQLLPIDADYLLLTTTAPPRPPEMINFDGVLDGNGAASALCFVPTNPALVGLVVYFACALLPGPLSLPLSGATNGIRVVIQL